MSERKVGIGSYPRHGSRAISLENPLNGIESLLINKSRENRWHISCFIIDLHPACVCDISQYLVNLLRDPSSLRCTEYSLTKYPFLLIESSFIIFAKKTQEGYSKLVGLQTEKALKQSYFHRAILDAISATKPPSIMYPAITSNATTKAAKPVVGVISPKPRVVNVITL